MEALSNEMQLVPLLGTASAEPAGAVHELQSLALTWKLFSAYDFTAAVASAMHGGPPATTGLHTLVDG